MIFLLIVIAVWVLVLGIWWVSQSAFRTADVDRLKARLLGTSKEKKKASGQGPALIQPDQPMHSLLVRLAGRFNLEKRLQEMLEQAGMKMTVARLIHACLAAGLAGFAIVWFTVPANFRPFAWLAMAAGCVLPVLVVARKRRSRMRQFEEQFPESLEFVARSMRAGHAFSVSLEMIHREFQEPLAGEFRRTFEEHNLGLPLDVALQKLARRVPSLDVHFFVSAVLLQKRTGGNLAEILDKLAYVIRERFKLRGKIRAISAHGKMTGTALTCIPIGVGVLMFYVNPDYIRFFFLDDVGNIMLAAAVVLQLIGYAVIRKIVSIEV
ncbi:MAG TPA: type II secretion system F family protein [Bryobacteraceae bacterium]|nr:type II secretion system F family protein [Bryobacteraceae bacterium]